MATVPPPPDPTHPTDGPQPTDKPSNNSLLWVAVAAAGAGAGMYWYSQQAESDPHADRLQNQERVQQKAQELKEAGKATAQDALREGQAGYDKAKVRVRPLVLPVFRDAAG